QLDHTSRKKAANEVKSRLRRLQDIEEEVEKTEARIEHTEKDINSYGRDYEKLLELYEQKKALQNKLDDLLKEWADLDAIQQVD
ncbi:MAG: ABC transporter C-terminal domain-containing protein, partial [Candidatus Celaenobacter antarcticus]|nr:ABC transporter C-terminal domain-containing protein [Candidatus Celaenobacter antarcticus]